MLLAKPPLRLEPREKADDPGFHLPEWPLNPAEVSAKAVRGLINQRETGRFSYSAKSG